MKLKLLILLILASGTAMAQYNGGLPPASTAPSGINFRVLPGTTDSLLKVFAQLTANNRTYELITRSQLNKVISIKTISKGYVDSLGNTKANLLGGNNLTGNQNLSGGVSGGINVITSGMDRRGIRWGAFTDSVGIYMESNGDAAGNSNMILFNGDNGTTGPGGATEGWIFRKHINLDEGGAKLIDVLNLNLTNFKYLQNDVIHSGRIGSGLSYSGGVLTATGTGGTVTNVSSANTDISVTNATTTPVISLNTVNGITKSYYDPTSSIQTQLNSKAPITGSTNYIQNGTTAQTANYNITGTGTANSFAGNYLDLVNQTSLASAPIGTMRVGVLNNRFGWMGSVSGFQFRREIYTNLAANTSFKLPYLASGTLVDSLTNAASVNLKQSKLLQNYVVGANTIVAASDSVGGAIGKLQAQITAVPNNYITSNTVQPSLSGNKTTTGRWSYGGTDLSTIFTFTTNFLLADVMLYNKGKFLYDALGAITTAGTNQNIDGVFGMTSSTSRLLITRSASDISNTGGTSISPSSITISQGATTNSTIFTPNSLSFGTALPSFSLGVSGTNQLKLNSDGSLAITTTPATASNATQVLTRNPTTQTIEKVDLTAVLSGDRSPVLVSASITMALNRDYLNTTATQYTLTLPSTVGFATEGSKIITVLATGTGGVKILLPSGYSMQAGTAFATTTGTGGATLTQGQKVQLIPIGTNAYYLQPLNGSITVY